MRIYKQTIKAKVMILFLVIIVYSAFFIFNPQNFVNFTIIFIFFAILYLIKELFDKTSILFNRIFIVFLITLSLIIAIDLIRANIDQNNKNNYNKLTLENLNKLDNFTIESNSNKYNIFFIETNPDRILFTTKQLCAIESAAKNNPNGNVYVLSIKAIQNEQFINLKSFYSNIKFMKFVPNEIFKGFINNNISII